MHYLILQEILTYVSQWKVEFISINHIHLLQTLQCISQVFMAAVFYIQLHHSDPAGSGTLPKLWTSSKVFLKLQGGTLFSKSSFLFFMIEMMIFLNCTTFLIDGFDLFICTRIYHITKKGKL